MHTGGHRLRVHLQDNAQYRGLLRRPGDDRVLDPGGQVGRACRYHRRRIPQRGHRPDEQPLGQAARHLLPRRLRGPVRPENRPYKDLRLGEELAEAYEVPMPLAEICRDLYAQAMARGWEENDSSIVLTSAGGKRTGVQVRLWERAKPNAVRLLPPLPPGSQGPPGQPLPPWYWSGGPPPAAASS